MERKKKNNKKTSLYPPIMAFFKSQKGEMDADKRIVSLTKRPVCPLSALVCISVLTPFVEYFFSKALEE